MSIKRAVRIQYTCIVYAYVIYRHINVETTEIRWLFIWTSCIFEISSVGRNGVMAVYKLSNIKSYADNNSYGS